jgi:hypothetical protein
MNLTLTTSSALNLTLEGSAGSFSVGSRGGNQRTVEVKYFLTHIGLNFLRGSNEELLRHLAPVREIFPTADLEFDEIMQRDIDDARVSSELIPYLLDQRSRDLVKLFPPIIVVVLPVMQYENRPADRYARVTTEIKQGESYSLRIVRSGEVGQEVFQFEQPIQGDRIIEHDLTRLKLNTNRCKLVIVDGQHRAMALLAIYRNLKQDWSDERRAPYKDFYEEWTPNYIRQFALEAISLPVMFCTFPELDTEYIGDYNIKRAARSIFLTLNKTARKVSESRNRLLDDNDLIALFLRDTLSRVKKKDVLAPRSLRIFNVELDQAANRAKIESPIAITGVNHIYYLIEHLILNRGDEDVNGAKPRAGKFYKRKEFGTYGGFERLDGRNVLGAEVADSTFRDVYTTESGEKLAKQFNDRFGRMIVTTFESSEFYEAHCSASLWLEQRLLSQGNPKLRPILFEGQGLGRVFATHREYLRLKLKDGGFGEEGQNIREIEARLQTTQRLVDNYIEAFKLERAERFLGHNADRSQLKPEPHVYHPKVVGFVNDLYENVFTTVAFQAALIAGFCGELERVNRDRACRDEAPVDFDATFSSYLEAVNSFFVPKRLGDFKRLVAVFAGDLDGAPREWRLTHSASTFRQVVYRGEMQPEQWPKFKYLILEIWRPTDLPISATLRGERNKCRSQVFNSLKEEYRKEYMQRHSKREDTLTESDRQIIFGTSYASFRAFLRNVGWPLSEIPTEANLRNENRVDDAGDSTETEDSWGSEIANEAR